MTREMGTEPTNRSLEHTELQEQMKVGLLRLARENVARFQRKNLPCRKQIITHAKCILETRKSDSCWRCSGLPSAANRSTSVNFTGLLPRTPSIAMPVGHYSMQSAVQYSVQINIQRSFSCFCNPRPGQDSCLCRARHKHESWPDLRMLFQPFLSIKGRRCYRQNLADRLDTVHLSMLIDKCH